MILNCIKELFLLVIYVSYKILTIKKQMRPTTVSIINIFMRLPFIRYSILGSTNFYLHITDAKKSVIRNAIVFN